MIANHRLEPIVPGAPKPPAPASQQAALAQRLQGVLGSRFEVLRLIAIGGMATIFQLRHRLHGGLFAAKVLHPRYAEVPELVATFHTEAVHAARLAAHPNIVPVYDVAHCEGLLFMVMPYIDGEDLDHLLRRTGAMSRQEALMLIAQISSALAYAELNGIAHCDVSPGNIRLDTLGQYRLLDFGLSRTTASGGNHASLGGTPAYVSPEQIQGSTPDIRSDLYALGIILLEALTGAHPFFAASFKELEQCHLRGNFTLPQEVASDLPTSNLLRSLLATDPKDRMQSAFELSGILASMGCELPQFRRRNNAEALPIAPAATRKSRLSSPVEG